MKRMLLIWAGLLASLSLMAGESDLTAKSDSLFAKGVELYRAAQYDEACRVFTELMEIPGNILENDKSSYSDVLVAMAECHTYNEDYRKALSLRKEALESQETAYGKRHNLYLDNLQNIAFLCINLGNYEEALENFSKLLEIQAEYFGKDNISYAATLYNVIYCQMSLENYEGVLATGAEYLEIFHNIGEINNVDLTERKLEVLEIMVNAAIGLDDDYENAIPYATEAIKIQEDIYGKDSKPYWISLNDLAGYNFRIGNNDEAIRLGKELVDMMSGASDPEEEDYLQAMDNLASYYYEGGLYEEAAIIYKDIMGILERNFGKVNENYALAINDLVNCYFAMEKVAEAKDAAREAIEIREKLSGKNSEDTIELLNTLAYAYFILNEYEEALRLENEMLDVIENVDGKENDRYLATLLNLANVNSCIQNYAQSIRFLEEALVIKEQKSGKENLEYADMLVDLADYHFYAGNHTKAVKISLKGVEILEKVAGENTSEYANALDNLSIYYSELANYSEAERLNKKALEIFENTIGKETKRYASSLSNLAVNYSYMGDDEKALKVGQEALEIQRRVLEESNQNYLTSLNNISKYHYHLDNFKEAASQGKELLRLQEKFNGKENYEYAVYLNNLSNYVFALDDYEEAIGMCEEAMDIIKRLFGKSHPHYVGMLLNLSRFNYLTQNITEVENNAEELNELLGRLLRSTFTDLTSTERNLFWQNNKEWYENSVHRFTNRLPTDKLISTAYDAALKSKGILLESDTEFIRIMQESGDPEIALKYEELVQIENLLRRAYEKPVKERKFETDSLEQAATRLERELLEKSKAYGDFTHNMNIGWRDVQQQLGNGEVAIEFVNFRNDKGSNVYAAYVLTPAMKNPEMVELFTDADLKGLEPAEHYTAPALSRLVWGRLDKYIGDAQNVYFAPSGELYNIAVENLPHYSGGGLMSEGKNFYRLTSTRELAVDKEKVPLLQAALYGGMHYETDPEFLKKDMDKYPEVRSRDQSVWVNGGNGMRGLMDTAADLPETGVEVDNITVTLNQARINSTLYKENNGTEASLKSLSGKGMNILHLATHGFYWTEDEVRRNDSNYRFIMLDESRSAGFTEDNAMTRTGLLFSGANNALRGTPLPEGVEDGVLTASEISQLDLRGLDLVVMSACQTGLGEIRGDGVFGLQRGFKKAGANTLLMSLWKVDDRATQMLMSRFYEELLGGKTKFEALRSAQDFVRNYEEEVDVNGDPEAYYEAGEDETSRNAKARREEKKKRREEDRQVRDANTVTVKERRKIYENPRYWAAFILLDALN